MDALIYISCPTFTKLLAVLGNIFVHKNVPIFSYFLSYYFLSKLAIYNGELSISMTKTKTIIVRITPEQEQILQARARASGFLRKSDYISFSLFMSLSLEDKISQIHAKVVNHE